MSNTYPFFPSKLNDQLELIYKTLDEYGRVLSASAQGLFVTPPNIFDWMELRNDLVAYARNLTDYVTGIKPNIEGVEQPTFRDLYVTKQDYLLLARNLLGMSLETLSGKPFPGESIETRDERKRVYDSLAYNIPHALDAIAKQNEQFKSDMSKALANYVNIDSVDWSGAITDIGERLNTVGNALTTGEIDGEPWYTKLFYKILDPSKYTTSLNLMWLWEKIRGLIWDAIEAQAHWWFAVLYRIIDKMMVAKNPFSAMEHPEEYDEVNEDQKWQEIKQFWPNIAKLTGE